MNGTLVCVVPNEGNKKPDKHMCGISRGTAAPAGDVGPNAAPCGSCCPPSRFILCSAVDTTFKMAVKIIPFFTIDFYKFPCFYNF